MYYIFGLQRSGTNFLQTLIKLNYKFDIDNNLNETWKHSIIPPNLDSKSKIIIIHKNPYTWIESICLRNCVDWQKRQIKYPLKEKDEKLKLGNNGYGITFLAKAWNDFHTNWLNYYNLKKDNIVFVKYENLINENLHLVIKNIESVFGWKMENETIIPNHVFQSKKFEEKNRDYYSCEIPEKLNSFQINFINSQIDHFLFETLDHKKIIT